MKLKVTVTGEIPVKSVSYWNAHTLSEAAKVQHKYVMEGGTGLYDLMDVLVGIKIDIVPGHDIALDDPRVSTKGRTVKVMEFDDYGHYRWYRKEFCDLKVGEIFRTFDVAEDGSLSPDPHSVDKKTGAHIADVCLSEPYVTAKDEENGHYTLAVRCQPVKGMGATDG